MTTIKDLITKAVCENKYFFTFKNEEELKKIFRLLQSIDFKWISGFGLNNSANFYSTLLKGAFKISYKGMSYGSVEIYNEENRVEKNIFDLFKELELTIKDNVEDFNIEEINCLTSIKTKNGAYVRIIADDLKYKMPVIFAYTFNGKDEKVMCAYTSGEAESTDYDLVFVCETLEKSNEPK